MKNLFIFFFILLTVCDAVAWGETPQTDEKSPYDEFFTIDRTIDRLKPTRFIIIDGEPTRLEDGMNLRGKDLSGVRINNLTLAHVDFTGAKLYNADFTQARFYQCNFHGAYLGRVATEDTHFFECDFSDAHVNDASSLKLSREEFLSTWEYKNKRISDRTYEAQNDNFTDFHFDGVVIENAQGCDFTNAHFGGECFVFDMTKEQLFSTDTYKTKDYKSFALYFSSALEEKESLSGADFSNCRIGTLGFDGYDLSGVDFTNAFICGYLDFGFCVGLTLDQLKSTSNWKSRSFCFNFGFMERPKPVHRFMFGVGDMALDWSNTDFSGFRFETSACLGKGSVKGANFTDARFLGFNTLIACPDMTVEQIKSTWNFKNREMRFYLGKTDLDWSGTDFSNFSFEWSNLDGADVSGADFTDARFYGYFHLENCRGLTIDQIKSTWNYKTGYMDMKLPPEIANQLRAEKEANNVTVSND